MLSKQRLKHAKELFLIAYPVSLGQLSHVITNISDSIMLGKYDAVHLAASTFAFNVFISVLIFSIGFSMGITPFVSQTNAEEKTGELKVLASNGLLVFTAMALLMTLLALPVGQLMPFMNQSDRIIPLAQGYYLYLALSLFPVIAALIFKQFSEGLGLTKPSMVINILSNGINIGLNYVFIFGKFGIEPMGIMGAGLATLISRCCILIFSILYVYRTPVFKQYLWLNPFVLASIKKVKQLVKISLPVAVQFTMEVSAFAVSAIMIGWLGEASLAAHQIAIGIAAMTYLIASGLGAASTVRVGHFVGKQEPEEMKLAMSTSYLMVIAFMGGSALFIFFFREVIPFMYVREEDVEIIQKASVLLMIASIFQLSDGVQVVAHGVLRGMKDVRVPTLFSMLSYWLLGVPVGYVLGIVLNYGVKGFWIGFTVGLTLLSFLLARRSWWMISRSSLPE